MTPQDQKNLADLRQRVARMVDKYGSRQAVTQILRRHPMFAALSRVTIYRWLTKESAGRGVMRSMALALDILEGRPVMLEPTTWDTQYVADLERIYHQLNTLRQEVRELIRYQHALMGSQKKKLKP